MKLYRKNDENSATADNDNEIQELKNMNIELKRTIDKMSHGIKSTGLRSSLVGNDSYYVPPLPKPFIEANISSTANEVDLSTNIMFSSIAP